MKAILACFLLLSAELALSADESRFAFSDKVARELIESLIVDQHGDPDLYDIQFVKSVAGAVREDGGEGASSYLVISKKNGSAFQVVIGVKTQRVADRTPL